MQVCNFFLLLLLFLGGLRASICLKKCANSSLHLKRGIFCDRLVYFFSGLNLGHPFSSETQNSQKSQKSKQPLRQIEWNWNLSNGLLNFFFGWWMMLSSPRLTQRTAPTTARYAGLSRATFATRVAHPGTPFEEGVPRSSVAKPINVNMEVCWCVSQHRGEFVRIRLL